MPLYFPLFFICTTFLCVFVYFILLVLSPIRSFLTCLYIFQRIHSSFFYLINILHLLFPFLLSKKEKPFQYNAKLFPLIIKSKHISNLLAKCNYFIPYCYLIIDFRPERKRWTAIYTYFLFQIFKLFQNENTNECSNVIPYMSHWSTAAHANMNSLAVEWRLFDT